MAINFEQVRQILQDTENEVGEYETASQALDQAKAELADIQGQVADRQAAVATATEEKNRQAADVVNGINGAIANLQNLLLEI